MERKDVKAGSVVMVPMWNAVGRRPAIVWRCDPRGAYVWLNSADGSDRAHWYSHWVPYEDMRKADAKTQASMKMIPGKKREEFFGSYQYLVLCAAPLGMRDTVVAGCRRWTSFRDAIEYYSNMARGDDYSRRKAAASKAILVDLKAKYDRALAKQNA